MQPRTQCHTLGLVKPRVPLVPVGGKPPRWEGSEKMTIRQITPQNKNENQIGKYNKIYMRAFAFALNPSGEGETGQGPHSSGILKAPSRKRMARATAAVDPVIGNKIQTKYTNKLQCHCTQNMFKISKACSMKYCPCCCPPMGESQQYMVNCLMHVHKSWMMMMSVHIIKSWWDSFGNTNQQNYVYKLQSQVTTNMLSLPQIEIQYHTMGTMHVHKS